MNSEISPQHPQCCCKNRDPIPLGEGRYECRNCKFCWRFLIRYTTFCNHCEDHGLNIRIGDHSVTCRLCGKVENISKFKAVTLVALW